MSNSRRFEFSTFVFYIPLSINDGFLSRAAGVVISRVFGIFLHNSAVLHDPTAQTGRCGLRTQVIALKLAYYSMCCRARLSLTHELMNQTCIDVQLALVTTDTELMKCLAGPPGCRAWFSADIDLSSVSLLN